MKKDRFKNQYFDDIIYDVSKLSFSDDPETPKMSDILYEGKVLISKEDRRSFTTLMKICFKELQDTGHLICKECGIEATILRRVKVSHINRFCWGFYAIHNNGQIVRFTKDHIVPKSLDNTNHSNNFNMYNITCNICNEKKSNKFENLSEKQRQLLTDLYRKERWIRSYFGRYLNGFYKKHKANEKCKPIINNYLNTNISKYIILMKADKTKFNNMSISFPQKYRSDIERDLYKSLNKLLSSLYNTNCKHPELVSTLKKFHYLFLSDIKNDVLTF